MKKINYLSLLLFALFAMPVMQVDAMTQGERKANNKANKKKSKKRKKKQPKVISKQEQWRIKIATMRSLQTTKKPKKQSKKKPNKSFKAKKKIKKTLKTKKKKNTIPKEWYVSDDVFQQLLLSTAPKQKAIAKITLKKKIKIKKTVKQKPKSTFYYSMVDQFIYSTGIDIYALKNNKRSWIQLLTKNVVVVKVPSIPQSGAQCGSHACENSNWLCKLQTFDDLKQFLNSPLLSKEVNQNAKSLKSFRNNKKEFVKTHKLLLKDFEKNTGKDNMSYEEAMKFNDNEVCSKIGDIHRTIITVVYEVKIKGKKCFIPYSKEQLSEKEILIKKAVARLKKTGTPEVFIVNTGGHWVTIRIERMSNGMLGILLVDSVGWEYYSNWLTPLAQIFA